MSMFKELTSINEAKQALKKGIMIIANGGGEYEYLTQNPDLIAKFSGRLNDDISASIHTEVVAFDICTRNTEVIELTTLVGKVFGGIVLDKQVEQDAPQRKAGPVQAPDVETPLFLPSSMEDSLIHWPSGKKARFYQSVPVRSDHPILVLIENDNGRILQVDLYGKVNGEQVIVPSSMIDDSLSSEPEPDVDPELAELDGLLWLIRSEGPVFTSETYCSKAMDASKVHSSVERLNTKAVIDRNEGIIGLIVKS